MYISFTGLFCIQGEIIDVRSKLSKILALAVFWRLWYQNSSNFVGLWSFIRSTSVHQFGDLWPYVKVTGLAENKTRQFTSQFNVSRMSICSSCFFFFFFDEWFLCSGNKFTWFLQGSSETIFCVQDVRKCTFSDLKLQFLFSVWGRCPQTPTRGVAPWPHQGAYAAPWTPGIISAKTVNLSQ